MRPFSWLYVSVDMKGVCGGCNPVSSVVTVAIIIRKQEQKKKLTFRKYKIIFCENILRLLYKDKTEQKLKNSLLIG